VSTGRPADSPVVDPSAAEFRRRPQPEAFRAVADGKKFGAPSGQPKFITAAGARVAVNL